MNQDATDKIIISLRKSHSLLAKIIQMTEDGQYCIDIMTQNLAAIGLLKSAHQQLMERHLGHCFTKAMQSQNKALQNKMTAEILTVTKLASK